MDQPHDSGIYYGRRNWTWEIVEARWDGGQLKFWVIGEGSPVDPEQYDAWTPTNEPPEDY